MKLKTGIGVEKDYTYVKSFALDNCTVMMYKNILVLRHFPWNIRIKS